MSERFVAALRDLSQAAAGRHASSADEWTAHLTARVRRARQVRASAIVGASAAVIAGVLVAGSALNHVPAPLPPATPSTSTAAVTGPTAVAGTSSCTSGSDSERFVDGVAQTTMPFHCVIQMSDPRVTGREDFTLVVRQLDAAVGATWTATDVVLTSPGGTWRGEGSGVVDYRPSLPAAPGLTELQIGRLDLVGEGAYQGLEFHCYIAGTSDGANQGYDTVGWIDTAG
jgi:hypothetical protein